MFGSATKIDLIRRVSRYPAAAGRPFVVLIGLLLITLVGLEGSRAEDAKDPEAAPAPPSLPEPRTLTADWWRYVSTKPSDEQEQALGEIVAAARTAADGDSDPQTQQLVANIAARAQTYTRLQSKSPPSAEKIESFRDQYTFDEVLALRARRRTAALETDIAEEVVARATRTIARAERKLSNLKAAYFDLAPGDKQRLSLGLQIIGERLRVAIEAEQLRLEKAKLEAFGANIENIDSELKTAIERLQIDPTEVERAASEAIKLSELAAVADRDVVTVETAEPSQDDSDLHVEAIDSIQLIAARARAAKLNLEAARFALQAAFMRARLDPSSQHIASLRSERSTVAKTLEHYDDTANLWRAAAQRERTRAYRSQPTGEDQVQAAMRPMTTKRIALSDDVSRFTAKIDEESGLIGFIDRQASAYLSSKAGPVEGLIARISGSLQGDWRGFRHFASSSLFEINETPVTLGGLLHALIILIIAFWISKLVRRGLERLAHNNENMNRSSLYVLGRILHYIILGTAIVVALSSLGLDFTKLAFIVGALGVGIGFGLQAIFSNFISGIIVLFERSLKVGDFVELESGVTGEVREINIRSTLITTNDNIDILVPNSEFVNGRVINWTLRDAHRRIRVPFGVAYGSDKDQVKTATLEAAAEVPFTLQNHPGRDPQVWLVEFGDSSLNFELVVWLTREAVVRPGAVQAAYMWAIETALRHYDIEIPFPQRDINVRSFFGEKDAAGLEWMERSR